MKQALQMALSAMTDAAHCYSIYGDMPPQKLLDAIEACREALKQEPVAWFRRDQLQHIGGGYLVSAYPNTDGRTDLVPLYKGTP